MATEAIGAVAPAEATMVMDVDVAPLAASSSSKPAGLHSPPDSNNAMALDGSDSELSDLDDVADRLEGSPIDLDIHVNLGPDPAEAVPDVASDNVDAAAGPEPESKVEPEPEPVPEDIGEVLPDHWSGTVPVFRPTMKQFKDFKLFMEKVDKYGMKSGIIKIIPPQEWKDSLPELHDLVKQVRVREPIKQDIMGSNGTYRQVNILHGRSYNLPQWRQLCDQSEHQPPARRGERRANAPKHRPSTRSRAAASSSTQKATPRGPGRKKRRTRASARVVDDDDDEPEERPMTPVSPPPAKEEIVESVEQDPGVKDEDGCDDDDEPVVRRMGFSRQSKPKTQSTSARRKYIRREGSAMIDEAAFKDWDYRMDVSEFTPERCEELERIYWKTLTYAQPLYGADLPGTLFPEDCDTWNLNKLPNLLDVLGTKVPGVNTAYLYLGMWKATFAWHLEDVDLYSINYLHFGAPKQWYSISQGDARRFEAAMKNIWPTEAKACDQFLRHKSFLISPAHLKQHYNITVNKCVSYPGEFVVTYPYGYHSGYNLGYNCAEAVNFALDSWLPMGKIAKKCQCAQAQDSVWVDVYEIERKLRGEETEYEYTEDEEEDEEDEDPETGLPSPPSSSAVRFKGQGRKRKRGADSKDRPEKVKRVRLRSKPHVEPPCFLCPHDIPSAPIIATDDGRKAHRMCALYFPETFIEMVDGQELVANVANIDKTRLDLKCLYCRSKKGACIQCSHNKCPRSYHATCAAAAGVFVEEGEVPVFGEDGTEYKEQAFEFSCRFHRTKRDRKLSGDALEQNPQVLAAARSLKKGDVCQMQYFRGDIIAGLVVENRVDEETLLLDVIPNGERVEIEWKWLLVPDPADYRLPKASANAVPLPTCRKAKQAINAKRAVDELPRKDDEFAAGYVWAEFHTGDPAKNPAQAKVDLSKDNQLWHYLGQTSTEAKAQYTENPSKQAHNHDSNFLDSIPRPVTAVPVPSYSQGRQSLPASYPAQVAFAPQHFAFQGHAGPIAPKPDKPYVYKPRKSAAATFGQQYTPQTFTVAPHLLQLPQQPLPRQLHPQPQANPHQLQQLLPQPQTPAGAFHSHGLPPIQLQQLQQPQSQPTPLRFQQYQPTAKPDKQRSMSAKGSSDRFAPVGGSNGFPQLPGLSWPPAHMTSGQYSKPHSAVWPPPADVPMTSFALSSSSSGHPAEGGVSVGKTELGPSHKYSFFQVHHNRDLSRYRTPYGPGSGFVNGYAGNLRAFLIKAQNALNGGNKTPAKPAQFQHIQPRVSPSEPQQSPVNRGPGSPYTQILPRPKLHAQHSPPFTPQQQQPPQQLYQYHTHSTPSAFESYEVPQPGPLHPAIRAQYAPAHFRPQMQQSNHQSFAPSTVSPSALSQIPQSFPPNSTPVTSTAQAKIPAFNKQSHSPIPLPDYVRQMVMSTGGPKSSPLGRSSEQASKKVSPSPVSWPGPSSENDASAPVPAAPASTAPPAPAPQTPAPLPSLQTQMAPITDESEDHLNVYQTWWEAPQQAQQAETSPQEACFPPPVPEATSPDNQALVEKMMANLRRASLSFGSA